MEARCIQVGIPLLGQNEVDAPPFPQATQSSHDPGSWNPGVLEPGPRILRTQDRIGYILIVLGPSRPGSWMQNRKPKIQGLVLGPGRILHPGFGMDPVSEFSDC